MKLTESQKKHLRRLSHDAKPIVTVGDNGLTDNVLAELAGALAHHELIKVRVRADDRAARDLLLREIIERCHCELIRRVGHVATLFRRNHQKPKIALPGTGRQAGD